MSDHKIGGMAVKPPWWTPHRVNVAAADLDAAIALWTPGMGVNTRGYRWGLLRVRPNTGAAMSVGARIYVWDDAANRFTMDMSSPAMLFNTAITTLPGQRKFNAYGRIIAVGIVSVSGTPDADIDLAVFGESGMQMMAD